MNQKQEALLGLPLTNAEREWLTGDALCKGELSAVRGDHAVRETAGVGGKKQR